MTKKDIEDLSDSELLNLYKLIDDFISYLEKEGEKEDAKWI